MRCLAYVQKNWGKKMQDIYQECPIIENERFLLRMVNEKDADALLKVYGDKKALPFFNSDNCNGNNFYCPTNDKMLETINFWLAEYKEKRYVRFAIVEKAKNIVMGTIELFNRQSNDFFNDCGLLRLDLRYDYENSADIMDIVSLIMEPAYRLFDCTMIATKAPIYAVDRIEALKKLGFELSNEYLLGHNEEKYDGYWFSEK